MKTQRLRLIVLVLTWIQASAVPTSALCPGPVTFEQQFARSQAVFVGRAIAQQIVPNATGYRNRVTETTFEVEELWKGQANTKTLRVQSRPWNDGNEAVSTEGPTFVIGSRYVVFASGEPLWATGCDPAELVDRAKDILMWLSGKPRK